MLGRLARYLRFMGHDTAYAKGRSDPEIAASAVAEGRVLLTRDRALAARVPGSVLLTSVDLLGQLQAVREAYPGLDWELRFTRCSLCNGVLREGGTAPPKSEALSPPRGHPAEGTRLYRCPDCGQTYWEGSHTAAIRRTLARVRVEA